MAFLDPNKQQDDDDALPGVPGLHLDLDVKLCPTCKREGLPWQDVCAECGTALVAPQAMPAESFALPHLSLEDTDDADDSVDP